jgi:hypothetical protein
MPDISTLVNSMLADGSVQTIARNRRAAFGRQNRRYLGTTLLPERTVAANAYRDYSIKYRTIIANDAARYSPVQLKKGSLAGSMLVELGDSDIGDEFSAEMYDALILLLNQNQSMTAVAQITNWLDTAVNLSLIEHNERQRWQAIVDAEVIRRGDNEYYEAVAYPDPAGHRAAQSAAWSTDSTDIFDDIATAADLLASKGFTVNRMITSRQVASIMSGNATIRTRTNRVTVNGSGQITSTTGRAQLADINQMMGADGLPNIELYDLQYRTQSGSGYFLPRDVFVLVATTGRDETIDLGDSEELFPDTLGYTAVGRAAGQSDPGRVIRMEAFENKPPRIEAQGWQTSLPVISEPEAIAVITSIT